jgi:hypothetical protein
VSRDRGGRALAEPRGWRSKRKKTLATHRSDGSDLAQLQFVVFFYVSR